MLDPLLIENINNSQRVSKESDDIPKIAQTEQSFILYDERIKCPVHKPTLK